MVGRISVTLWLFTSCRCCIYGYSNCNQYRYRSCRVAGKYSQPGDRRNYRHSGRYYFVWNRTRGHACSLCFHRASAMAGCSRRTDWVCPEYLRPERFYLRSSCYGRSGLPRRPVPFQRSLPVAGMAIASFINTGPSINHCSPG